MAEQRSQQDIEQASPLSSGNEVNANAPGQQAAPAGPFRRERTDQPTNTAAITTGGTTGEGPSADPPEG